MTTILMKIRNFFAPPLIVFRAMILLFMFVFVASVQNLEAVEPDGVLFSEQAGERDASYKMKSQQLEEKIAGAVDDKEKKSFLIQKQLLTKLEELPDKPEKPSIDLRFSELAPNKTLSWQEVEQYLGRYISVSREGKISSRNVEDTTKQMQDLYSQLIALADQSPEQDILQLQYAYQVRKSGHQSEIDTQLKEGLEVAKEQYPAVLEHIHIGRQTVYEQEERSNQTKKDLQRIEDEKNLEVASGDVLIQQLESVLAGYLGKELTDDERKVRHYKQLKLLKQQVQQLSMDHQIVEGTLNSFEEEQKAIWFRLLGEKPDFFTLADLSGDLSKKIILLRKRTNNLHAVLYTYEKELSTLSGGNALVGPKAQELITTLDKNIRTVFTLFSGADQRAELLENKGHLLDRAIDLKQSALGSMVTKTRDATDDIFEKAVYVLKYPLVLYSGMSLSLFLVLQVFSLLVFGVILNRLYGRIVMRMGIKRKWSERTVHLAQVGGKYPFIFIVAMFILSVVGINTRSLALVAGALSVGIGFGMQTIVNNLVSGIILLFDKSIRPGDFISLGENSQTGGFRGNVVEMNIRATVLRTNDNINIIIPNADLMASKVVNWTYSDERIRFRVPFSVAYGTNIDKVKSLVKEALLNLSLVLPEPEPQILMAEHADSSLSFLAAIWVEGRNTRQPARTTDTILTTIYKTLDEHSIEIPFPQMELRMRGTEHQSMKVRDITDAIRHKMLQGAAT